MKKNYLKMLSMVFVISLFTSNLFAQGAYVHFNAGYGFNAGSQNINGFCNFTDGTSSSTTEQINVSLGTGLNVGGTFGFMFTKNVGAELGLSYLLGGKTKANYTYIGSTQDLTVSSSMLRVIPSLVIASGLKNINPYAKFGLVVGVGSITNESETTDASGDIGKTKEKYNGGVALGLSSGIGIMFDLNKEMSIFGELDMINLSYAPTKSVLTESSFNGTDNLPNLTTKQKETEYVSSLTDTGTPIPDTQPDQKLKQKAPFGSVGVNFGFRISF